MLSCWIDRGPVVGALSSLYSITYVCVFFLVSKFDHVCVLLHFAVPMRLHTHTKVFVLFSELRSVSVSLSDAMCPGQAMLSEGWFCKSLGSFPARGDLLNHSTLQTRASDVVAFI